MKKFRYKRGKPLFEGGKNYVFFVKASDNWRGGVSTPTGRHLHPQPLLQVGMCVCVSVCVYVKETERELDS